MSYLPFYHFDLPDHSARLVANDVSVVLVLLGSADLDLFA